MQEQVRTFMEEYHLSENVAARCIDLVSELGELSKELLKSSAYGQTDYVATDATFDEYGDCLFSLLALGTALGIDAVQALRGAMGKYRARLLGSGRIDSGK